MVALGMSKFNSSIYNKSTRSNWAINPSLAIHCSNLHPMKTPENLRLIPGGINLNKNNGQKWVYLLKWKTSIVHLL